MTRDQRNVKGVSDENNDGLVFVLKKKNLQNSKLKIIETESVNQRLYFQDAVFIQFDSRRTRVNDITEIDDMVILRIKAYAKSDILRQLELYGIATHKLFPDLDGLSKYWNSPSAIWQDWLVT